MKKMALFGLLILAAAVSIFFFIFAFSGFDFAYLQKNFSIGFVGNSKAGPHIKLGTEEYINSILDMERGEGPRSALSQVMKDVRQYPKELDKNTEDNINRLHKLISTLIYHIGYVDEEVHYFRNELNRAPKSLKALMDENMKLPLRKRWKLLSVRASAYHIQGPDGEYNLKFMSYDSYSEAVYDKNGVLLTEK